MKTTLPSLPMLNEAQLSVALLLVCWTVKVLPACAAPFSKYLTVTACDVDTGICGFGAGEVNAKLAALIRMVAEVVAPNPEKLSVSLPEFVAV